MKYTWLMTFIIPTFIHAQVFNRRALANYKKVEIYAPIEINVVNENDIVLLYCKTKELTSVILPLRGDEVISAIGTGDDEKVWQTGGMGSKVFTVKPSDLADKTSTTVRTTQGRVFHFRLQNLSPARDLYEWETEEETRAYVTYLEDMNKYDPYTVVVLGFRDNNLKVNEELLLQQKRAELDQQIVEYKNLNQRIELEKEKVKEQVIVEGQSRSRIYASLVDYHYDVKYKNKKIQKKWDVQKVFNDGTFTWVEANPNAPAFHVYEVREGKFELANFELDGNLYRIDRVCASLEFRDGPKGDWVFRVDSTMK